MIPLERGTEGSWLTAVTPKAVVDRDFDSVENVYSIRYRLHPLDVGFDLRAHKMAVAIAHADDPLRVSYPARDGGRRVMEGPRAAVLRRLRARGFRFIVRKEQGL